MSDNAPQIDPLRPLAGLQQRWGLYAARWEVFADRLEMQTSTPLGARRTELPLAQIDTVTTVEEVPWPVLLFALLAGGVLGVLVWGGLLGDVSGGWVFLAALVAGFALGAARWLRLPWVQVETVGGQRFYLLASIPSRGKVGDFLRVLRQCRTLVLSTTHADWAQEGFEELGEGSGGDQEPIDPRWIN